MTVAMVPTNVVQRSVAVSKNSLLQTQEDEEEEGGEGLEVDSKRRRCYKETTTTTKKKDASFMIGEKKYRKILIVSGFFIISSFCVLECQNVDRQCTELDFCEQYSECLLPESERDIETEEEEEEENGGKSWKMLLQNRYRYRVLWYETS